ncbi:hypothetical protein D3C75_819750 [compost metagenome]
MLLVLLQLDFLGQLPQLAVDPDPDKTLLPDIRQQLGMFALASRNHRRQNLQPGALRVFHQPVHHLLHGLGRDLHTVLRAVWPPDPRKQQPQVVINLRYRTYRRTGIPAGGFLVDRDSRGEAFDGVYVRFVHLAKKLPGIRGQRFHITPLPFRIDGIKSKG